VGGRRGVVSFFLPSCGFAANTSWVTRILSSDHPHTSFSLLLHPRDLQTLEDVGLPSRWRESLTCYLDSVPFDVEQEQTYVIKEQEEHYKKNKPKKRKTNKKQEQEQEGAAPVKSLDNAAAESDADADGAVVMDSLLALLTASVQCN
jgi:hypothetical protein